MDVATAPSSSSSEASVDTGPSSAQVQVEPSAVPEALQTEQFLNTSGNINIDAERHANRPGSQVDASVVLENAPISNVPSNYQSVQHQALNDFVQQNSPRLKGELDRLVQEHPEIAPVMNTLNNINLNPQQLDKQAPELKKAIQSSDGLRAEEALATMVKAANDDGLLRVEMAKMTPQQRGELVQGLDSLAGQLERGQPAAQGSPDSQKEQSQAKEALSDRREQLANERDNTQSRDRAVERNQLENRAETGQASTELNRKGPELVLDTSPRTALEPERNQQRAQEQTGSIDRVNGPELERGMQKVGEQDLGTSQQVKDQNLRDIVLDKLPDVQQNLDRLKQDYPGLDKVLGNLQELNIDPKNLERDLPALSKALDNASGLDPDQQVALLMDALKEDGLLEVVQASRGAGAAVELSQAMSSVEQALLSRSADQIERQISQGDRQEQGLDDRRRAAEYFARQESDLIRSLRALDQSGYQENWAKTKAEIERGGPELATLVRTVEEKARHHHERHEERRQRHGNDTGAAQERAGMARDSARERAQVIRAELAALAADRSANLSARERSKLKKAVKKIYAAEREELMGKKGKRLMRKREALKQLRELQRLERRHGLRKRRLKGRLKAASRGGERLANQPRQRRGRKYQKR